MGITLENTWQEFLKLVSEEVGSRVVETWFKAVQLKSWDVSRREVILEAPNAFVRDWIWKNYVPLCGTHLGRLLNSTDLSVKIVDARTAFAPAVVTDINPHTSVLAATVTSDDQYPDGRHLSNRRKKLAIHDDHSFDTFVVGPHNSLACAAARAVVENPGKLYNPLFIYGASGLGKTHLLNAIGNGIRETKKSPVVVYQPAARFVSEFITAIRFNKTGAFEQKYHMADLLLIDDIQFISHKEQTQEAFFHIFNSLYDARKQIVFTSDTFPDKLEGITERLRSRFNCGLITDLHAPTLEAKVAILKKKAQISQLPLDDDVAYTIAALGNANIRELEGALIRVIAHASLTGQRMSSDLVRMVLSRSTDYVPNKSIDPESILKILPKYYPCTKQSLCSASRTKEIAFARHVAMFLLKRLTDKSLRDIGKLLGGRDHSTVMHAIERITLRMEAEEMFAATIKAIERELLVH